MSTCHAEPEVFQAILRADGNHPDDVKAAVAEAEAAVRALPGFQALVDRLVQEFVSDLVHDVRHKRTKATGAYRGPAKVPSITPGIVAIYENCSRKRTRKGGKPG